FPELFAPHFEHGVTRRAFASKQIDVRLWPLRDFGEGTYRRVDDRPFGGGPGMVVLAEPLERALAAARTDRKAAAPLHLSTPTGRRLEQGAERESAQGLGSLLLCVRYEFSDQHLTYHQLFTRRSVRDFVKWCVEQLGWTKRDAGPL